MVGVQLRAIYLVFCVLGLARPGMASGPPPLIVVQPLDVSVLFLGIASFTVVAASGTTITLSVDEKWCEYLRCNRQHLYSLRWPIRLCRLHGENEQCGRFRHQFRRRPRGLGAAGITTQPQSQAMPVGQSAAFSVVPSGSAPFSYQWSFNGTNLSGATASSLEFNSVQAANAGSYNVVVSNPFGSTASSNATLTVYIPPTITTQPQSQLVAQHQAVSFSVLASGSAPFSYQWYLGSSSLGDRAARVQPIRSAMLEPTKPAATRWWSPVREDR